MSQKQLKTGGSGKPETAEVLAGNKLAEAAGQSARSAISALNKAETSQKVTEKKKRKCTACGRMEFNPCVG